MGGAMKAIGKMFGMGSAPVVAAQPAPEVPDYEAERRKAEEDAQKKRNAELAGGLGRTVLGGSLGEEARLNKKRLLGE